MVERAERMAHHYGIKRVGLAFEHLGHVFFRQRSMLRYLGDNLFVVVFDVKLLGKSPPEFSAAAAEFSAYSNDNAHIFPPENIICLL